VASLIRANVRVRMASDMESGGVAEALSPSLLDDLCFDWLHNPLRTIAKFAANSAALLLPVHYPARWLLIPSVGFGKIKDHVWGAAMSTFGRKFSIELISDQIRWGNPWFKDMLLGWRPAGDALHRDAIEAPKHVSNGQLPEEDPKRLRLAVRNGYLNLYRGGQSVARIGFDSDGGLQARIHNKYVNGDKGSDQAYVTLTSAGFLDQERNWLRAYGGLADLHGCIANANKHVGKEKRFVDLIVARNADIIDLEMALPAYSLDPKERRAPRMDLVALEPAGNRWRIVFWEAKLVSDARARCRGDDVSPKVVDQLMQYTTWLRYANHLELVASAYQNVCRLLVAFHRLAKRVNPGIEELGPGIIAAAAADMPRLLVDDEPRLLIDNRTSDDSTRSLAFTKNGHLDKLRRKGLCVQMVDSVDHMTLEPRL
jgi:hypothetical protein